MCTCTELVLTSPLCSWCVCVWLWSVRYKQHGDLLVTTLLHSAASVPIPPPQGTFNMLIEIWLKGYSCIKYKILSPEGLKRMIPHLFHPHEKSFVYIWYFSLYRISQKGGFMWNVQMCVISPFTVHDCYSMFCLVKVAPRCQTGWKSLVWRTPKALLLKSLCGWHDLHSKSIQGLLFGSLFGSRL